MPASPWYSRHNCVWTERWAKENSCQNKSTEGVFKHWKVPEGSGFSNRSTDLHPFDHVEKRYLLTPPKKVKTRENQINFLRSFSPYRVLEGGYSVSWFGCWCTGCGFPFIFLAPHGFYMLLSRMWPPSAAPGHVDRSHCWGLDGSWGFWKDHFEEHVV